MRERAILGGHPVGGAEVVQLTGLRFQIGDAELINVPDLTLGALGITVIMGPNGAGKSLLLRLLHGLIAPTEGLITIAGQPFGLRHRRKQALVFQKPVLLRRTAAANIDFVLRARGKKLALRNTLLERVGLAQHGARPARRFRA